MKQKELSTTIAVMQRIREGEYGNIPRRGLERARGRNEEVARKTDTTRDGTSDEGADHTNEFGIGGKLIRFRASAAHGIKQNEDETLWCFTSGRRKPRMSCVVLFKPWLRPLARGVARCVTLRLTRNRKIECLVAFASRALW